MACKYLANIITIVTEAKIKNLLDCGIIMKLPLNEKDRKILQEKYPAATFFEIGKKNLLTTLYILEYECKMKHNKVERMSPLSGNFLHCMSH
jgi:hypothetical protein